MVSQLCALQKQYGKTQAELETLVEGFYWALADYDMAEIIVAMREYIKTASDIPAPADIIKIMDTKREYTKYLNPPIEKLLRYEQIGLKLTDEQKQKIAEHRASK